MSGASELVESEVAVDLSFVASAEGEDMHADHDQPPVGDPEPGPTPLRTDSQSARNVSYNPEHHDRMKHVQRRHFFVRDMVESFEIEDCQ